MVQNAAPAVPGPGEIMQRPSGYEDKGFELLKPSVRPNMSLGNAVRDQQAQIEAQRQSGNVNYQAAAAAAAAQAPPAPAAPSAPAAPRQAGSAEEALFLSTQGVHNGIDHFTHTLERELDELTKLSMVAIQNQDMAFAQRAVARTATLKKFRDAAASFKGDWQAVCSD
jgi:pyruvate/2-oxoglutarate dehydrogenase complex dihydrolipoamide acyltransferase (E2) component